MKSYFFTLTDEALQDLDLYIPQIEQFLIDKGCQNIKLFPTSVTFDYEGKVSFYTFLPRPGNPSIGIGSVGSVIKNE